jgi:branched-chain amino acid transport system permease protein
VNEMEVNAGEQAVPPQREPGATAAAQAAAAPAPAPEAPAAAAPAPAPEAPAPAGQAPAPAARMRPGRPGWVGWALLAAGLLVAWGLPRWMYPPVALDIVCWALLAVAVDLLLGYTGLLSFGHAAFWGSAAYTTGLVALHLGWPFPLAVLAGAVLAAALAVRRTGIYFAMVTLAFAQMLYFVANEWRSVTGGENGLQDVPRTLLGMDLSDPYYFYYAALPLALLGFLFAWRVVHSPFGRVLVAIRDNPARVRALGYPVHRYKIGVFVLSAFLAGLGGGLFAEAHGFVSLDVLHWTTSGKAVILVVLGGIGTLWGGTVGSFLVVRLEDWLSLQHFEQVGLVTGGIFVLVVLLFRRGIWGTVAELLRRRVRR